MSTQNTGKISRRAFLRGAVVTGAAVAAAGSLPGCSTATTTQKWDKTADVVVVGSGTVATAAVVAAEAGLNVIVLEKSQVFGGTTALSGGGLWIPNNYVMQAAGVKDSKEEALQYLQAISEGASTNELMSTYLDKANEMLNWLRDKAGFKFQRNSPQSFADYYPWAPGVHTATGGRMVSILRDDKVGAGKGLIQSIKEYLDAHNKVEIMMETPGKRLVVDNKGAVTGVIATANGAEIAIQAKLGVILGTGGFDYNADMAKAYLRGPIFWSNAVTSNTGDGHLMGMAIGADLRNMNSVWGLPGYVTKTGSMQGEADWQMYRGKPGSVTVNKYGERFMNEASAYHPALRSWYAWDSGRDEYRNIPSYALFDSGYVAHYPMPGANYKVGVIPDWFKKADTLSDLAKALNIDPAGLQQTIERFNANAKNGVDPDWRRGEADFDQVTAGDKTRTDLKNPALAALETPPFYGAAISPGTCGTNGGLRTNTDAQVLNVWGQPIVGLYATGNTMASVMGASYPGGGATVGQGMAFAYVAAQHMISSKSQG